MLSQLQIENVAIIKKAVIDFKNGFNVMTGETGAGKSIIIDSLNAVLGERTSRELIRSDSNFAYVNATFYDNTMPVTNILCDFGIEAEADGTIIISRKITDDGKNVCKINGISATVSMLKTLGRALVNIHGQLDSQALLSPESHCVYIDSIAENNSVYDAFSKSYADYTFTKQSLKELNIDEENKARRLDILDYQINELEKARISVGEWDVLREQQQFYRNYEKISIQLKAAYAALNGDDETDGAVSLGFSAVNSLQSASSLSDAFNDVTKNIEECVYNLSSYTDELRDSFSSLEYSEQDINAVEERLDVLYNLSKKYGKSEQEMLEFYDNAVKERDAIVNSDELKLKLEKELNVRYNLAFENAKMLSNSRKEAGKSFADSVCRELEFLEMPGVRFFVNINEVPLNENGIDDVEFFLSANAGEEPKPLHKIASGGELSRIMLAIKSVLADKDGIDTLVFDEIDTGVSGRAAQKIALKLRQVSLSHQVICVTHLAQIAAIADEHLLIEKSESDGKTYTELKPLDFIGRKYELARIMGGLTVTELLLKNAEEMLKENNIK